MPTTVEEISAIVRIACRARAPIVGRMAGLNVGGLTLPAPGAIVVDFVRMNRILELNTEEMYVVVEPGVTFGQLSAHLAAEGHALIPSYPLSPPTTSVAMNCLLDGLANLSERWGAMGDLINGLEVVIGDGSVIRTGAWAVSDVGFSRSPLPDLTGLFLSWQGTTGLVTKCVMQLFPKPALRRRYFVMCHAVPALVTAMRRLTRRGFCTDIGGLSWPAARMILGVHKPHVEPVAGEPVFFLYLDFTAEDEEELTFRERRAFAILDAVRSEAGGLERPIVLDDLLRIAPGLKKFAEFPTTLDFLLEHEGKGLTWIGTYGPLSHLDEACARGMAIMVEEATPPLVVMRPMKAGHFSVLRFITLFDKQQPSDVERARRVNVRLADHCLDRGYVPYKCPTWLAPKLLERMGEPTVRAMRSLRDSLDPHRIFNPGRWLFPGPESTASSVTRDEEPRTT